MRKASFVAGVVLAAFMTGCSSLKEDPTAKWSVEKLYGEAKSALDKGNYQEAIKLYDKLEARYPYGPYAEQSELEVAYAHYKAEDSAAAVSAADRFIKQHPTHPNVDYAYYLRGLASFNPPTNFLESWAAPEDLSERDPSAAREAFNDFKELVTRFPNSKYTPEALQRMTYLRDTLARSEVHVADYYMRRKAWLAASDRAKYVVENYQRTPAVGDALAILVTAYREMGLDKLAADTEKVLNLNFPGHAPWKPHK